MKWEECGKMGKVLNNSLKLWNFVRFSSIKNLCNFIKTVRNFSHYFFSKSFSFRNVCFKNAIIRSGVHSIKMSTGERNESFALQRFFRKIRLRKIPRRQLAFTLNVVCIVVNLFSKINFLNWWKTSSLNWKYLGRW